MHFSAASSRFVVERLSTHERLSARAASLKARSRQRPERALRAQSEREQRTVGSRGRVELDRHRKTSVGESDRALLALDRKSTRLNSSHANISYAVFCLKKKQTTLSLT